MAMRSDCRHYESRTYGTGEVVRKCRLDLAPDAPWQCPDDCAAYELRRIDVGWQYGSLTSAVSEPKDRPPTPDDTSVAALLDEAEDIVNAAAPDIVREFKPKPTRGPFRRRKKK
jgi:hypothetical protein